MSREHMQMPRFMMDRSKTAEENGWRWEEDACESHQAKSGAQGIVGKGWKKMTWILQIMF